jgi:hypothetical protein
MIAHASTQITAEISDLANARALTPSYRRFWRFI